MEEICKDQKQAENTAVGEQPASAEKTLPAAEVAAETQDATASAAIGAEATAAQPLAGEGAAPQEAAQEIAEDELSRLTKQLQAKEQEAKEQYEARLRLQAELENFKKRKEKESAEFRKYANESFLQDILPILDDFERALTAAEQTHKLEDLQTGVKLIFTKLSDALQKKGVKEVEAKEGQPFNPELHEAVMQMESEELPEGMIAKIFQKGYALYERVLRPPKVAVARKKA